MKPTDKMSALNYKTHKTKRDNSVKKYNDKILFIIPSLRLYPDLQAPQTQVVFFCKKITAIQKNTIFAT